MKSAKKNLEVEATHASFHELRLIQSATYLQIMSNSNLIR